MHGVLRGKLDTAVGEAQGRLVPEFSCLSARCHKVSLRRGRIRCAIQMFGTQNRLLLPEPIRGAKVQLTLPGIQQGRINAFLDQGVRKYKNGTLGPHQIAGDQLVAAEVTIASQGAQCVDRESFANDRGGL